MLNVIGLTYHVIQSKVEETPFLIWMCKIINSINDLLMLTTIIYYTNLLLQSGFEDD